MYWPFLCVPHTIWIFMLGYILFGECEDTNYSQWDGGFIKLLTAFYFIVGTSGDTLSPTKGPSSLLRNDFSHPETMKYQMSAASDKGFPLLFRADCSRDSPPTLRVWHSRSSTWFLSLLIDHHKGVFVVLFVPAGWIHFFILLLGSCSSFFNSTSNHVVFSLSWSLSFISIITFVQKSDSTELLLTNTPSLRMFSAPCKISVNSWLDSLLHPVRFQIFWVMECLFVASLMTTFCI